MTGRPKALEGQDYGPRITIRLTPAILNKLDALRRKEGDIPTRAEMTRRIIERANGQ